MTVTINRFATPLGEASAYFDGGSLTALFLGEGGAAWCRKQFGDVTLEEAPHPLLPVLQRELEEYLAGDRQSFTVPLVLHGTPTQKRVWEALRAIPYGETRSYSDVAQLAGCASVRAVGTMVGQNPLILVVPCHRVVKKGGELGNYSGVGGPATKEMLLHLESGSLLLA